MAVLFFDHLGDPASHR